MSLWFSGVRGVRLEDKIRICTAQAGIQDQILQSYRRIFLTAESILIAVGFGLLAFMTTLVASDRLQLLYILSLALASVGLLFAYFMNGIIRGRGLDVNFWNLELLKAERELPPHERHFTEFTFHQKTTRGMMDDQVLDWLTKLNDGHPFSDDELSELLRHGLGKFGRGLDVWIPYVVGIVWIALESLGAVLTLAS